MYTDLADTAAASSATLFAAAEALSHDIKSAISTIGLKFKLAQTEIGGSASTSGAPGRLTNWRREIVAIYDAAESLTLDVRRRRISSLSSLRHEVRARLVAPLERMLRGVDNIITVTKIEDYPTIRLREARKAIFRVTRILNGLLIELSDDKEYEFVTTNLRSHAETAIEQLYATIEEVRGRVAIEGSASVVADQTAILSMYTNIIENSLKYSRVGIPSNISINLIKMTISQLKTEFPIVFAKRNGPDDWVRIVITDNGLGISDDDKERVFDLGYRVTTDDAVPGTGYGLSRVRTILRRHRGRYLLQDAPSGGLVFSIFLPSDPRLINS